jgi:hypothetical protein
MGVLTSPLKVFIRLAVSFVSLGAFAQTRENPHDVPDYVHESQTCERIDLRPALVKIGLPKIRNRGGRLDNFSFAVSEMLSLELAVPVSARWLEHWFDSHSAKATVNAISLGHLHPCSESAVRSEDIESTRLARLRLLKEATLDFEASSTFQTAGLDGLKGVMELLSTSEFESVSLTPWTCKATDGVTSKIKLHLNETKDASEIDRSLRQRRLPVLFLETVDLDAKNYAVVGRRLSPSTGLCEYLLRSYQGPTCLKGTCEDGSVWIERALAARSTSKIWTLQ